MKLKKSFIIGIISIIVIPFVVGLAVNYTYDKIKNHSNANKSGFQIEINININFN